MKKTIYGIFSILLVFSLIFSMATICVAEETEKKHDLGIDPSILSNPDALFAEGMKYFTGDGVDQDIAKGCALIYAAANQGSTDAMMQMGYLCAYGFGPAFDKDFVEGSDPVVALNWFMKVAEIGDLTNAAFSIIETGYDYLLGRNESIPENTAAAIMFFEAAEKLGVYNANDTLGIFYTYGAVVDRDPDRALQLFVEGAKAGNKECEQAIEEYGYAYYAGTDDAIDINFTTAFQYYSALTEFNNERAMYNVGLLYMSGLGVSQDQAKAEEWIQKAADAGYEPAKAALKSLKAAG